MLHLKDQQKKVKYFNLELVVPGWVKFLAVDEDGEMYGYELKPRLEGTVWYSYEGKGDKITDVEFDGTAFNETLVEVE